MTIFWFFISSIRKLFLLLQSEKTKVPSTIIQKTIYTIIIMKAIRANWFETKIKYDKTMEDGLPKPQSETYVVDALSFTEAEQRIMEEMSSYISGEFEVKDIKKPLYKEICFSDDTSADKWFKVKVQQIVIDEKTEKEKRSNIYFLVQAATLRGAVKNCDEMMSGSMIDYEIASVAATQIMDVFQYDKKD